MLAVVVKLVVVNPVATVEQAFEMRDGDQVEMDAGVASALPSLFALAFEVTVVVVELMSTSVPKVVAVVKLVTTEVKTEIASVMTLTTVDTGGW